MTLSPIAAAETNVCR